MDTHLTIRNLSVSYGGIPALQDIALDIPRNAITVIMGPSGCGKTTLLKCLNRFCELTPTAQVSGSVCLDGTDIYARATEVTTVRRQIGLLAQRPMPLPMSIEQNVAYGMQIHRLHPDAAARHTAVRHFLEVAGLWEEVKHRLHDPAASLSIGQQQRLCLARGLAVEPSVILGDEPTSALDPISAQHIEQKLIELKHRYTTVVVTHTLRQAKRIADYVVFMYMGAIVESGPAAQIFAAPQQERTQQYIAGVF